MGCYIQVSSKELGELAGSVKYKLVFSATVFAITHRFFS